MDGKELLSDYHEDVPEAKPDEYVENSIDNKSEEVRETTNNKKNLWKNYLPRIAIGLGVIIVILVVYVLYARLSSSRQNNQANNNDVTVSSQKSSSSSSKKPKKVAVSKVKVTKINDNEYRVTGLKKNRRLVVRAGDTQNISAGVQVNGNANSWQSTLLAKQKHTMTLPSNAERVVITLGNDNGTSITIAGKKVPYAPNNAYRTITLLIGKGKRTTSQSTNNNTTTNTTNNSSSTQSRTTTQSSTTRQSSRQQSSATTQSSQQTQQSSQTQQQSSTTQSSTANNNGGNDGGDNNNN